MTTEDKTQYDKFAAKYTSVVDLPYFQLEAEFVRLALDDCTGLTVLDLGGGSGIHARDAIDAGAALVDVVDISSEMLREGEAAETALGRSDRIRWFQADITQPLVEQVTPHGPHYQHGYDIVMVNWTFNHATSIQDLRAMWTNVSSSLKPGGRFLGVRVHSVDPAYISHGKYGIKFTDVEGIPDGVKYWVEALTEPPVGFEGTAIRSTSVTDNIAGELGLVGLKLMNPEKTEVVQKDLDFWAEFIKDPFFVMVTASKA
ncbi:hypothetical protein FE257_008030 [Aspergillus nanangensis]|uniref:Methyltransferase domain-containing protein n=1 Tax=Aspergillus nanangensis TaxID=2582783 RepID=A0AAD4CNN4_ASPNN|nr:hypothetical protein FE257_008030 [Aspergillus nanangensis]